VTLEERVQRLEVQNRRLRRTVRALFVTAGATLAGAAILFSCARPGQNAAATDAISAKKLQILNEQGQPVIVLQADPRGFGRIATYRGEGGQLVQIAATDEGGTIAVAGSAGKLRAGLGVTKEDAGAVFTFDRNDRRLLSLGVAGSGDGALFSYLRNGELKQMWP
jgi:hypothetical protein